MKLIIFDLDGTLTESKQPLTGEMAALVAKLLAVKKVAVASGGALPQFLKQVFARLPTDANFVWTSLDGRTVKELAGELLRTGLKAASPKRPATCRRPA